MTRKLEINEGVILGVTVRQLVQVFPEITDKFTQRKSFDEYYFASVDVELTIEKISKLNKLGYQININNNYAIIEI